MKPVAIHHDIARHRFETEVEGHRALLDYRLQADALAVVHTGVPQAIGGRGIAAQLVQAAVEYARSQGLKVSPQCSYAAAWMDRHPEYADLRA